ncbi:MAG: hypothetical protein LBB67_02850 [Oscillospiraceae bacterium]|jgi:hypothetical protein|nr:hypothetical protein [Oscillospiraceae bacterium]
MRKPIEAATNDRTAWDRIKTQPKKWQLAYWWAFRACFIYGLLCTIFWHLPNPPAWSMLIGKPDQVDATKLLLMMVVYLPVCFLWEIFQFFPAKSIFRNVAPYFQNISVVFALSTGFFGAFVNFYYTVPWWDDIVHAVGGALSVMLGYEICSAIQRRDKVTIPFSVIMLTSIGVGVAVGVVWELFEFTFDQGFGGDTQHWSLQLAREAGQVHPFFQPAKDPASLDWERRFALMDTMSDIVLNAIGTALFAVFLGIYPYNHRGANNPNVLYAKNAAAVDLTSKDDKTARYARK